MYRIAWALLAFLPVAWADGDAPTVPWRGEAFAEIRSLTDLPTSVQKALGVGRAGIAGVANVGGRYNPTDAIDPGLPMRRFAVAGISPTWVVVACERGGIGYSVEVSLFARNGSEATAREKWTLFQRPTSLRDMISGLEAKR